MKWRAIRNQTDADELMRIADCFHDWYMAGFEYDPLARTGGQDKNLARFVDETDSLLLKLRYDSRDKTGIWPEIEMEFSGVYMMRYMSQCGSDPFSECALEKLPRGWAFVQDGPLTEEERENLSDVKAGVLVVGGEARWRGSGFVERRARLGDIKITVADITGIDVDAVVNAANEGLRAGGGVCGAIFRSAGHDDMQGACAEIGRCDTGDAVITPGFALNARYVVHAVGPVWEGGRSGEAELLGSCYKRALDVAAENGCESIAFPLISSGIYGYPKDAAWYVAVKACFDWLGEHDDQNMSITFCVLSEESKQLGESVLDDLDIASCR